MSPPWIVNVSEGLCRSRHSVHQALQFGKTDSGLVGTKQNPWADMASPSRIHHWCKFITQRNWNVSASGNISQWISWISPGNSRPVQVVLAKDGDGENRSANEGKEGIRNGTGPGIDRKSMVAGQQQNKNEGKPQLDIYTHKQQHILSQLFNRNGARNGWWMGLRCEISC